MEKFVNEKCQLRIKMQKKTYREKRTISAMIDIYCREQHHKDTLCEECQELLDYAQLRIDRCMFGQDKPACKVCPVHCYSPKMREKVKEIMKFSGPKMIYKHPVMAIMHIMK
jgi:hypothetical protein